MPHAYVLVRYVLTSVCIWSMALGLIYEGQVSVNRFSYVFYVRSSILVGGVAWRIRFNFVLDATFMIYNREMHDGSKEVRGGEHNLAPARCPFGDFTFSPHLGIDASRVVGHAVLKLGPVG